MRPNMSDHNDVPEMVEAPHAHAPCATHARSDNDLAQLRSCEVSEGVCQDPAFSTLSVTSGVTSECSPRDDTLTRRFTPEEVQAARDYLASPAPETAGKVIDLMAALREALVGKICPHCGVAIPGHEWEWRLRCGSCRKVVQTVVERDARRAGTA